MTELIPGSPEWILDLCKTEYRQTYEQCAEAGRHYNEWRDRLADARRALYAAAKNVNGDDE